jgi:hypothetical protein
VSFLLRIMFHVFCLVCVVLVSCVLFFFCVLPSALSSSCLVFCCRVSCLFFAFCLVPCPRLVLSFVVVYHVVSYRDYSNFSCRQYENIKSNSYCKFSYHPEEGGIE